MNGADLAAELVAMAESDRRLGEAFFAAVEGDERLSAELAVLLENPATPLLSVLPAWASCPDAGRRLAELTVVNAERLGEIVLRHRRWPGLSMVGALATDAAWLVAQHADLENELRRRWLPLLRSALDTGDADPRHLAYLVDRIAVVDGAPQEYGTVVTVGQSGLSFPHPLADPSGLAGRRAAIGLPPIEAELLFLARGEVIPFGPDRPDHPIFRWPA